MDEGNLSQDSKTSIAEKIDELEIFSSEYEGVSSQASEVEKEAAVKSSENESSSTSSTTAGSSSSTSHNDTEQPQKRRRKRKRHRKKKAVTAYIPEEPFPKRYKKISLEIAAKPKLHIKFDDEGNVNEKLSMYNFKARIVRALAVNLTINDTAKRKTSVTNDSMECVETKQAEETVEISLKPRIIKAIGT
jgi:hypothetical protein